MRIVIAEDTIFRDSLALLLRETGLTIDAAVADGESLLKSVDQADPPDVAILDIRMPPTFTDEGIRTAEQLRLDCPTVGVLIFSTYAEVPTALRLLDLPGTGGVGYALKERVANPIDLVEILDRVVAGDQVIDPVLIGRLLNRRTHVAKFDALSTREREVMQLLAAGRTNHAIATVLHLSEKTVDDHVSSIFQKLNIPRSSLDNRRVLAVVSWLSDAAERD